MLCNTGPLTQAILKEQKKSAWLVANPKGYVIEVIKKKIKEVLVRYNYRE